MSTRHHRSRAELAAETASRLIGLAQLAFAENGFQSVTLEGLALKAGLTRGALHHHFTNKAGLFAAVVQRIDAEIAAEMAVVRDAIPDPWTGLRASFHGYLDATLQPSRRRILFQDMSAVMGIKGIDLIMASGFGDMPIVMQGLIDDGTLRTLDAEAMGQLLIGALINLAFWAAEGDVSENRLPRAHTSLDAVLDGLSAPQAISRIG
jgi:AcrR family transcriptional regulator